MKVAVIQFGATADKDKNLQKTVGLVERAARNKAKFIALPEVFIYRGKGGLSGLKDVPEKVPGPTTKLFGEIAKRHKAYILLGSLYEKSAKKKVYNTSVLLNPQGKIQARYRKINLFDAHLGSKTLRESETFLKGSKKVLTSVQNFKIGLSICFDLRFPEIFYDQRQRGAHVFVVPSAFTKKTGQAHWKTLLRARAIEHQCYVLAPNQVGKDGRGVTSYGHSLIIDPWGKVLAEAKGVGHQILYATLHQKEIQRVRKIVNMQR